MNLTEKDISGPVVRTLRERLGLTQTVFWSRLGVRQPSGARYEADTPIPQAVRILIVANYVSGLHIDAASHDGVAELSRLGTIQAGFKQARHAASAARIKLDAAAHKLKQASEALAGL